MEDIDVIVLEDNKEYAVLDIIEGYFYLVNIKNNNDFCIRKLVDELSLKLNLLNDTKEFDKALDLFRKKYKK